MSLLQPWIQDYVIGTAEQLGADFFNAPSHKKSKTVQIIEFLHRGSEGRDANVWARVSDSSKYITIKFTPEAAAEYLKFSQNIRLTQHHTAIIRIKNFKLFLGRVALGENKMTPNSTLALECTVATPHGSFDEKKIGNPLDITAHPAIKMWIEGLREGGGSGNVLKEKRIDRERQQPAVELDHKDSTLVLEQQKLDTVLHRSRVKQAPLVKPTKAPAVVNLANTSRPAWRPKMPPFYEVPPEILAALRALPIEGEGVRPAPKRDADGGNNENNEGFRKRSRIEHDNEEQAKRDVDMEDTDVRSSQPLSDWSSSNEDDQSPTPGQRQPPSPAQVLTSSPDSQKPGNADYVPHSSLLLDSQKIASSSLGPPPISSSYAKANALLSSGSVPKEPVPQDPRSGVMRRVPPPKQPQEVRSTSGPEQILVPASDSSMSQSQSQSHSQQRWGGSQRRKNLGSSPMRGLMEEETKWLQDTQEMAQRAPDRQLARKSSYKVSTSLDISEADQQGKKVLTHVISKDAEGISEDDEETDKRVFIQVGEKGGAAGVERLRMDMGKLPPGNDNDGTSRDGRDTVWTSVVSASGVETPGQHEPGAWKQPSFMKRKGRLKLGGFTVELKGLRKGDGGNLAWLSWRELRRVLGET